MEIFIKRAILFLNIVKWKNNCWRGWKYPIVCI